MLSVLVTVVGPLVVNVPLVVALVVCLVLTVKRRKRDPRGARLVVVGLAVAFVSLLLSAGLQALSSVVGGLQPDVGGGAVLTNYTVVSVIASLFGAAGWILAAVALIRTRRSSPPTPAYGQPSAVGTETT